MRERKIEKKIANNIADLNKFLNIWKILKIKSNSSWKVLSNYFLMRFKK